MYTLVDTTIPGAMEKPEGSIFEGVDVSLTGLAKYAGATPPEALTTSLGKIAELALHAKQAFDAGNDAATVEPIEAGLTAVRALRSQLASMGLTDDARYEIDFRLKTKEQDYVNAVLAAHAVTFVAVANDGLVIAGQPVQLSLAMTNRGTTDVSVTAVEIAGFESAGTCTPAAAKPGASFSCTVTASIPKDAAPTEPYFKENYWSHPSNPARNDYDSGVPFGVPFAPTPFRATVHLKAGTVEVTKNLPFEYRYVKDLYFGDKQMELNVVPAFSVRVTPTLAVFPLQTAGPAARAIRREVYVAITNSMKGPANVSVRLEVPSGWNSTPATVPVNFQNEDESLSAKFLVTAPATAARGSYTVRAVVTSETTGAQQFSNGYQEIEYPHVQRRQVIKPAEAVVKVIDVKTVADLKVGYIMGVGDQVPPAIEQLGGKVSFIEQDELAWGDLSKYDVIMTGVRAYERRADLRAYNRRLLDYVAAGGTMIVNYNKTEFNAGFGRGGRGGPGGPGGAPAAAGAAGGAPAAPGAPPAPPAGFGVIAPGQGAGGNAAPPTQGGYGPFPALIDGSRVNDETVPVNVLDPEHALFNYPNRLGPSTWENWVQERGQYFLSQKDPRYTDLVSMTDSFPDNPGVKLGSLVEARHGKGHWVYVGLGLWRQLPAGTDGAYQLLANLLALPKAPANASAPKRN
jgi:hypothetical protein